MGYNTGTLPPDLAPAPCPYVFLVSPGKPPGKQAQKGQAAMTTAATTKTRNDISIWVGNLAAYTAGELRGEWFALPATDEEIHNLLIRIGCGWDGKNYLYDWAIFDYDDYTGCNLARTCGEYENIHRLSEFAELWEDCDDKEKLAEIASVEANSVDELINLAENLDDYMYIEALTDYDLGVYYAHELGTLSEYPEEILTYFDYEAYGRDISFELTATKNGYYTK